VSWSGSDDEGTFRKDFLLAIKNGQVRVKISPPTGQGAFRKHSIMLYRDDWPNLLDDTTEGDFVIQNYGDAKGCLNREFCYTYEDVVSLLRNIGASPTEIDNLDTQMKVQHPAL
jgi:hypothetical protein